MVGGGSSSMRMVGGTTVSFDPKVLEWKDDGRFAEVLIRRKTRANVNNHHRNGPSSSFLQSPPAPSTASDESFPAIHRRCASINPSLGWNSSSAGRSSSAAAANLNKKQQQSSNKPIRSAFGRYFSARGVAEKLARAFHMAPPPKLIAGAGDDDGAGGGRRQPAKPYYYGDGKKIRQRRHIDEAVVPAASAEGGGNHCSISGVEYSASEDSEAEICHGSRYPASTSAAAVACSRENREITSGGNAEAGGQTYICCRCMDDHSRAAGSRKLDVDRQIYTSAPAAPANKLNAGKILTNPKRETTSIPQAVTVPSSSLYRTQLMSNARSLHDRDVHGVGATSRSNSKMHNPPDHDHLQRRRRQQPAALDVAGKEEVTAHNVDDVGCGFSSAADIEMEQLRAVCRDQKRTIQELKSALAEIDADLRHQLQLFQRNSSDNDTCNYCCYFCCHGHGHEKNMQFTPLQSSVRINNHHHHYKDGSLPSAGRHRITNNNAPAEASNNASTVDDFDVVVEPASCAISASRRAVDVNIAVEAEDDDHTSSTSLGKVLDFKQQKKMAPRMMLGGGGDDDEDNNMIAGNGVEEQQQQPEHSSKEMELDAFKNLRNEISGILKGRAQLQQEAHHLHLALTLTNQRVEELEDELAQKERDMQTIYDELEKTRKERDTMHKDAEFMGQEAIRLATQVDRLSKRVEKLDEDVLMKDGQLSILRGALQQYNE